MNVDLRTQAVLLLTAWFTKPRRGDPKPLTPVEWGRFAQWLNEKQIAPENLLTSNDPLEFLSSWKDSNVEPVRISSLLRRSAALGFALEKWQRVGLWVMTRSDNDYPTRLKKRLKHIAPPIFYGCGPRHLLDRGGIAVVGSRKASEEDLEFTSRLAANIAVQGYSVVSGGARGVDETAMLGALDKGGTVIGVLTDNLLRAVTSAKYREALIAKSLVLISPFNPEAKFDVGNAMARNKYVYCLADAAVVVTTSREKGGTWNGAIENLKQGWVPLWVNWHPDSTSENAALMEKGARWLPHSPVDVHSLVVPSDPHKPTVIQPPPFDAPMGTPLLDANPNKPQAGTTLAAFGSGESLAAASSEGQDYHHAPTSQTLYEYFLLLLHQETHLSPQTAEALQKSLDLNKNQLNDWLKRAVAEGKVKKLHKPVRYQATTLGQRSLRL